MTKRMIEVDDVLPECVAGAIEEVERLLRDWATEGYSDNTPPLGDLDGEGLVHEVIDGAVPVYTAEIEAAWFLHGNDLEEAYENAGIGTNPRENNGMAAIYCYISEKVAEWYDKNADQIFQEVRGGK